MPMNQDTNFTDDACRDFLLPTPLALDPQDVVWFNYVVDFPGSNDVFHAKRASFILKP